MATRDVSYPLDGRHGINGSILIFELDGSSSVRATLMSKKTLLNFVIVKILVTTCQIFGRISYIVNKIWQQTKCSYFFVNFTKIW